MTTKTKIAPTDNSQVQPTIETNDNQESYQKLVVYLNKQPNRYKESNIVIHWTEAESKLSPTAFNLKDLAHDNRIANNMYECRFYSVLNDKEYCQVVVDRDYVVKQLMDIIDFYCDNDQDLDELIDETKLLKEKIKRQQLEAELAALSAKFGISPKELAEKIKNQ